MPMSDNKRIILASGSPRRKELLTMIFERFDVLVADCEEVITGQTPEETVKELSQQKALAVASGGRIKEEAVIIGADTVVSAGGEILGKPKDQEEACRMISMLSGKTHKVCTGVTLIRTDGEGTICRQKSFAETTSVRVAELSAEEIGEYIRTEEPYDKAGGYGIQGLFGKYIEGIEGDYNNVVGLPVHRLYVELGKMI